MTRERRLAEVGDLVQFVYGGPGPDITYGVVVRVDGDAADFYDIDFGMMVRNERRDQIWVCTERSRTPELEAKAAAYRVQHGLMDPALTLREN